MDIGDDTTLQDARTWAVTTLRTAADALERIPDDRLDDVLVQLADALTRLEKQAQAMLLRAQLAPKT